MKTVKKAYGASISTLFRSLINFSPPPSALLSNQNTAGAEGSITCRSPQSKGLDLTTQGIRPKSENNNEIAEVYNFFATTASLSVCEITQACTCFEASLSVCFVLPPSPPRNPTPPLLRRVTLSLSTSALVLCLARIPVTIPARHTTPPWHDGLLPALGHHTGAWEFSFLCQHLRSRPWPRPELWDVADTLLHVERHRRCRSGAR